MTRSSLVQNTTISSVNPVDPTNSLALNRVGGRSRGADEQESRDADRDEMSRADLEASRRGRAIARRQSMPNGEWAIRNSDELRAALAKYQNPPVADALSVVYGAPEIQRHIIQRARDLQMVSVLPTSWGVNMEDQAIKRMIESIGVTLDSDMLMTTRQLLQASRFFSAKSRRAYASKGVALPDGSFPIPDRDALRRAIRLVGKGGARAKQHIIKRAKALGATGMLPDKWVTTEDMVVTTEDQAGKKFVTAEALQSILVLDGTENAPMPLILEDQTTDNGGFAKIKVPFYVGDSISRAPGFDDKILFPTSLLGEVIGYAKQQIREGRQPLTVYPRHRTALDGSDLPIGGIVDLVQEGRIGYVVADIVNKGKGEQAIALIKHKDAEGRPQPLLNAVSLRAGPQRFEMERIEIDDKPMLKVTKLCLDGVDFAPDSPAMKTYGIEFLAAESRISSTPNSYPNKEVVNSLSGDLTMEVLRSQYRSLVEEIEAPYMDEIARLNQEITNLDTRIKGYEDRERRSALAQYVHDMIGKLPEDKRAEGGKLLMELAAECKTKEEFTAKAFPIFLDALDTKRKPTETAEDRLRKLFPSAIGNGVVNGARVEQEVVGGDDTEEEKGEYIGPLLVPHSSGV